MSRVTRVAVLARSVYPLHRYGGLERHVYDLVRGLIDRGARVTLIAPPPAPGRPVDPAADAVLSSSRLTIRAVPYRTFPFAGRKGTTILDRSTAYLWFGWCAGRAAADLARAGAVDIVHGHGASALGYAIGDVRAVPFVFNPHGLEEFGTTGAGQAPLKQFGYWPLRVAVRRCARAADRVIATDRALVQHLLDRLQVRPDVVRVVPNAIEPGDCDRPEARALGVELRRRAGLGPEDVVLLSVGRLEANKGFGVLARALRELAPQDILSRRRWRWVIVGDGPMQNTLQREIAACGLDSHALLCGRTDCDELHGWYEAATLFVHPTLYEGSSLVTLEAMAHRRAIVASRAGGLPDKVKPGVNGWLVDPGDERALAAAIGEALSDPARLSVMGAESRAIVEREFSWRAATDRLLDVYEELLTRRGSL